MSEPFDPYHEWLGIPASEQPPHHYRLLGIAPFEESPTVIQSAADRQMAHLRTFQTGKHVAESQRLLNEVAAARICLLDPAKKAAHDRLLRQRAGPSSGPADRSEPGSLDPELAAVLMATRTTALVGASGGERKQPRLKPLVVAGAVALAAAALAVVGLTALWWTPGRNETSGDQGLAKAAAVASAKVAKEVSSNLSEPATKNALVAAAAAVKEKPQPVVPPVVPPAEQSKPNDDDEAKPAPEQTMLAEVKLVSNDSAAEKPDAETTAAKKIDPPSADEQQRLLREINEVYKPGEAKDSAAKSALARKLLEDGRKNEANRAEQFVLLRRAEELARDAGDADLMLDAVDAIAAAGFNIQPMQVKSRLLTRLVTQAAAGETSQLSSVTAACVKFAEEAAAHGAIGEAANVLDAANKSLAEPRKRTQTAYRMARAAAARARNPADKAAREKKATEAQDELEAIKSAQSALAECVKGLQQARHEHEAIQAAQEQLKAAPDDPDACLTVGRWYCFSRGDWDEGLKLLAKGSDAVLKSLAAAELASQPAKAPDQIARGDAWWDSAEKADSKARGAMRRRAGHWYEMALPNLSPGLGKSIVEKRLAQAAEEPAPEADAAAARIVPPLAVAPFNEKTAKQHQARWAKYLRVPVVETNSIGMKLVLIPPGEFQMGSPKELIDEELRLHPNVPYYSGGLRDEGPQHRVRITKPYWLGATVVTQAEYQRVMGSNPSNHQGDPQRPVERVSWDEAAEFCRRLSELPGERAAKRRYELPTEARWEYACRAGSTGRWSFSPQRNPLPEDVEEKILGEYAWINGNAGAKTHPVAQKRANAWGLYDMHGNVWEWCQDWYDKDYYARSPVDDPTGPPGGWGRVGRGGSYSDPVVSSRSAFRFGFGPDTRDSHKGLRVALVPADEPTGRAAQTK